MTHKEELGFQNARELVDLTTFPRIGSYNIGYFQMDKRLAETQGDVHVGYTWEDFFEWLAEDLKEDNSNINRVAYIEWAFPDEYLLSKLQKEAEAFTGDNDYANDVRRQLEEIKNEMEVA